MGLSLVVGLRLALSCFAEKPLDPFSHALRQRVPFFHGLPHGGGELGPFHIYFTNGVQEGVLLLLGECAESVNQLLTSRSRCSVCVWFLAGECIGSVVLPRGFDSRRLHQYITSSAYCASPSQCGRNRGRSTPHQSAPFLRGSKTGADQNGDRITQMQLRPPLMGYGLLESPFLHAGE